MSQKKNVAVEVSGIYKNFVLPHQRVSSVKSIFTNPFQNRSSTKSEVQHAIADISFRVEEGEFFGIVGRNGSGKSTLLKIIAEIYRPTKGYVKINGRLVPFIELGVGFNPELTGRENVYLNGALMGFSDKEIDAMYEDIVAFAELENFMDQKLKNYSSGMQVRLAFSVATRAKAEILLIDEVLAVGDADFQRKCFNYFKSLKKSGTTVIFVSHDMDAVREYCDRAILIEKSKIIAAGETDKVAQKYTKLFIDDAEESQVVGGETSRWGKGGVKTSELSVEVTKNYITINHRVDTTVDAENPNIGIRIRSVSGDHITGTNTKIEKFITGFMRAGDTKRLVWEIPNVLADGDYYVDAALLASDGITVYDWWDEAAKFRVKKERTLPYLIDPGFQVR